MRLGGGQGEGLIISSTGEIKEKKGSRGECGYLGEQECLSIEGKVKLVGPLSREYAKVFRQGGKEKVKGEKEPEELPTQAQIVKKRESSSGRKASITCPCAGVGVGISGTIWQKLKRGEES